MRHWSLRVVSGETVRLYLHLTHHLEGSATWSNRRLALNQSYVEAMMSLDHQTQLLQCIGARILWNRGTHCWLGWSGTKHNLHPCNERSCQSFIKACTVETAGAAGMV